jgi:predicted metal-dependent enzyme (double-stranded beta helix superfamily)
VFDVDEFINEVRRALAESEPRRAVKEILEREVSAASAITDVLQSARGDFELLHHSPDLTIANVVWAPHMTLYPHNHLMWAAIGIYGGQEDNYFYRRGEHGLVASGGKEITTGDVILLGDDVIHSVTNPRLECTGAIHIYAGDFVNHPRSQWSRDVSEEEPYDFEQARQEFARANAAANLA